MCSVLLVAAACGDDDAPGETDSGMTPSDGGADSAIDGGPVPTDGGPGDGGSDMDGGDDPDGGACPTGMAGADCSDCAEGYQDADDDGVCELGCDATGDDALDCGDRGTCEESASSGSRRCVCDTGWAGDLCDECAAGWSLVDDECEPELEVITGLRLWYDADHANVVTNASDEVTAWPSRVGTFPLVSPAGARPTLATNVWNGRAVVVFDSDNERVASSGSTNALSGEDFTVFVVAGASNLMSGLGIVSTRTGTNYATFLETTGSGYRFVHRGTAAGGSVTGDAVATSRPLAVPDIIRAVRYGSIPAGILQLNVAEGSNLMANTNTLVLTESATVTSHAFVIGVGPGGTFRGRVGEVLVYDRVLTGPETMQVHQYLRRRWGL
ncbi:MAG: hypothetical protein KF901_15795 [Myxococcales bacterium]|nr:hypothetical protein [Myxococcales bacterium]